MAMAYFPAVQVLTLLQALYSIAPPGKKKKSLRVYTGCPCYTETRWELGACFVYHKASSVGGSCLKEERLFNSKTLGILIVADILLLHRTHFYIYGVITTVWV